VVELEENSEAENLDIEIPIIELENPIVTIVSLPSRKLKIKISSELLQELEKMGLNFKLN
jgi:DNA polymerase-3 subunit alpha